jgi:DNA-binding transcriptional LysR family regulator
MSNPIAPSEPLIARMLIDGITAILMCAVSGAFVETSLRLPKWYRVANHTTVDLNLLQNFVAICNWGSVTDAAKAAGLPKSSVSRQLQALEDALGVRLLHRTTRQLTPTEAGTELLTRASLALAQLSEATREIRDQDREPAGSVKFSAPQDLGAFMLPEVFAEFLRKYPRIQIDADFSIRRVDLIAEGFDCAIRIGPLRDSSLVARRIGCVELILVCSPSYAQAHGPLRTLVDLSAANCLLFRSDTDVATWALDGPRGPEQVSVHGNIRSNDLGFLQAMARRGCGVALIPAQIAAPFIERGELLRLLSEYSQDGGEAHILTPTGRFVPHRVRLFVDHVATRLREIGFVRTEATGPNCAKSRRSARPSRARS